MKWKQVSIPPDDAQFLETRKFQVREIARIFRVPPHMVGDLEQATFSNIEHQGIEFVIHSLRPWLVRWEQTMNWNLVSPRERGQVYAEFLIEGMLRGDIESRYRAYATGRQNGWLSANDVLELENMNPLPGEQGNIYMVPLNMTPASDFVGDEGEPGEEPTTGVGDDPVFASAGGLRRGQTPVSAPTRGEQRALEGRRRLQRSHRALIKHAAGRAVHREVQAGKKAVKAAFNNRNEAQFFDWMEEFYREHRGYVLRQMLPVVRALGEAVWASASEEVGPDVSGEFTAEAERFAQDYAETVATRMVSSSEGQLRKVIAETPADRVASELDRRFDEWEEERAEKVASRESVQAGSAFAKAAWVAAGVTRVVWMTVGQNCPLCNDLDGRTVGIQENFVTSGARLNPGGVPALNAKQNYGHPPLHEGCDCSVGPG